MNNITNSTHDKFCCDSNQINVLFASGILGIILVLILIFWIARDKCKYRSNRSIYQVIT